MSSEQTLKELWMSLTDKQTPLCRINLNFWFKFYFLAKDINFESLHGVDSFGCAINVLTTDTGWQIYKEPKKKIKVYCPALVIFGNSDSEINPCRKTYPNKDKSNWFANPDDVKVIRWHEEEVAENFDDQEEAE